MRQQYGFEKNQMIFPFPVISKSKVANISALHDFFSSNHHFKNVWPKFSSISFTPGSNCYFIVFAVFYGCPILATFFFCFGVNCLFLGVWRHTWSLCQIAQFTVLIPLWPRGCFYQYFYYTVWSAHNWMKSRKPDQRLSQH